VPPKLDQPDVGGDAARQRPAAPAPAGADGADPDQRGADCVVVERWAEAADWVMIRLSLTDLGEERP
jgi:hypothetical protein